MLPADVYPEDPDAALFIDAVGERGPKLGVVDGVLSNTAEDENDIASGIGAGRPTMGVDDEDRKRGGN
jgi:hypothetical protein